MRATTTRLKVRTTACSWKWGTANCTLNWATVYILDATATSACPIDRPQIQVNVTSGNKGRQFSLTASPEKNERAGSSSRFVSADRQLVEALTDTDCKCRIAVLHAGIPYGAAVPQKGEYAHQH
jgi:hypothetical protein